MLIYDNEYETKEIKNCTKDNIGHFRVVLYLFFKVGLGT